MGPDFVVVFAPFSNAISGLRQALKPLLIQAFVSELSIETLDLAVLHGPARLNQNVAYFMQSGPSQEGAACEFMRLPLDKLSDTKSMLHTSLTLRAI